MKYAKFGPGGNSARFAESGYRSSLYAPEWVSGMGLDAYEYECGNGVSGSEETFASIGLNACQHGIAMSVHAPYYISLSGIVEEKRLGSIKYIMQSLYAARCLGASIIVVHPGSTAKLERAEATALARDTLEKTAEEAIGSGFADIKIGLETMGKINQLGTLDEVIELCKTNDIFVPVIDFGHLYARSLGSDILTSDDIKRIFDKIAAELGADIATELHCHFSSIAYTKGGESKHLVFGNGEYGPDPIVFARTIAMLKVSPTVICESAGTQDIDAKFLKAAYMEALR